MMGIPRGAAPIAQHGPSSKSDVGLPRAIEGVDRGIDIVLQARKVAAFGQVEHRELIKARLAKPCELLHRAHRVAHPQLAAHHFFADPHRRARLSAARAAFVEGFGEVRKALGLADDEAEERQDRRRGQLGHQQIAEDAQDIGHRLVERQLDRERIAILRDDIVDHRREQFLLRREIGPERRLRSADLARDRRHRRARIAVREEQLARRVDERLAPRGGRVVEGRRTIWYHFD